MSTAAQPNPTTLPTLQVRCQLSFAGAPSGFTLRLDETWPGRGVTALFGPSGCGKTTTLRIVAGLHRAPHAQVAVHGQVWQGDSASSWVPPHQRPLGYVFQQASLFAHLSVRANVEFGMQRVPASQRRVALDQAVELLGIGGLMNRQPDKLSGGEAQRVAMARALATSPRLLLLDEPLAALDAARKAEVLPWLERLHRELDIPVLYVSHAIDEVARLADHLVLMDAGRVLASGPTAEVLTRAQLPLAHGDAAAALLEGVVHSHDAAFHLTRVTLPANPQGASLELSGACALPPGTPVRLRVQARDVSLCLCPPQGSSILNILRTRVLAVHDDGPGLVMVTLTLGHARLLARITAKSAQQLGIQSGLEVMAQVKGVAVLN